MDETNVSLKLMIDRESQRVLFAEAGKEFIDFLFQIMALPVGTFIPLFEKQGMQGSFGNIFESIENLGSIYFQPSVNKEILLKPKVHISAGGGSGLPPLLQNVESSPSSSSSSRSTKFYRCKNVSSNCDPYVAYDIRAICPSCSQVMNCEQHMVDRPSPSATKTSSSCTEGGYVKGLVTYMVMDDLEVKLMSTISSTTLLVNKFNVKGIRALEEKVVNFGMDEGVKLLKASLYSKSVLTDVFLPIVKQKSIMRIECKSSMPLPRRCSFSFLGCKLGFKC